MRSSVWSAFICLICIHLFDLRSPVWSEFIFMICIHLCPSVGQEDYLWTSTKNSTTWSAEPSGAALCLDGMNANSAVELQEYQYNVAASLWSAFICWARRSSMDQHQEFNDMISWASWAKRCTTVYRWHERKLCCRAARVSIRRCGLFRTCVCTCVWLAPSPSPWTTASFSAN